MHCVMSGCVTEMLEWTVDGRGCGIQCPILGLFATVGRACRGLHDARSPRFARTVIEELRGRGRVVKSLAR